MNGTAKSTTRKIALVVGFALILLVPLTIFVLPTNRPAQSGLPEPMESRKLEEQEAVVYGLPVRLKVPKIKVDAAVSLMGLKENGDMEAPKDGRGVGWYKIGSRPGNNGTAVMAGHYGQWKNGEGSVFDDLDKLEKGDKVYVEDDHGVTATFVVRELRSYRRGEKAPSVFNFSSDGKAYLNLVTCQGDWNEGQGSYSDRLVVFAYKEIAP